MVSTVTEHKKLFSRCKIFAADTARALYCKIGRPNEAEFQVILRNNMIHNCPVTPDDAKRALIIYGPDIAALKDKTTQTGAAPRAPAFVAKPIPATILEHQSNVTLCVDFSSFKIWPISTPFPVALATAPHTRYLIAPRAPFSSIYATSLPSTLHVVLLGCHSNASAGCLSHTWWPTPSVA
jgi:hypothetical protein